MQQQWAISWLDCDMQSKVGFYTTGNDQLSGWTKKKLQSSFQSQTCTKKRSWALFDGLWYTTAFWILMKPLHLRSMLSKLIGCTKNCNACSWYWSTEKAQFSSTTTPDCMLYNQCFTSWPNWATKFCFNCHIHLPSHQPITTSWSISTILCRENASTTSRRQKMLSKSISKMISKLNPEEQIFML